MRTREDPRLGSTRDTGEVEAVVFGNYRYTAGPLIGLLALCVILGMSRFVFGTGRPAKASPPVDFGLLVPVASMTRTAAERARTLLAAHGIRATLADRVQEKQPVRISADGRVIPPAATPPATDVLVFPADRQRASSLLAA